MPGVTLALRYLHEGADISSIIRLLQENGAIRMLAEFGIHPIKEREPFSPPRS